jgi:hypothetical protein
MVAEYEVAASQVMLSATSLSAMAICAEKETTNSPKGPQR